MSGVGDITETNNDDDGFQVPVSSRRKSKKSNADKKKKNAPQLNRQRRSAENYTGKQLKIKARSNGNKKPFSNGPSLSARGWSKPNRGWTEEDNDNDNVNNKNAESFEPDPSEDDYGGEDPIDRASETMASIVGAEINTADDKINAALAATAASTTMASLMKSMGFAAAATEPQQTPQIPEQPLQLQPEEKAAPNFASFSKGQKMEDLFGDLGERDPHWKEKQFPLSFSDESSESQQNAADPPSSFASFCKGQSTAGLLGDFGVADPNWKQKVVEEVDENEIAEENEDEEDQPAIKSATPASNTNQQNTKTKPKPKPKTSKYPLSKLVPHGKAAIHLSIESFGVAHGAPSRGSRDRSGSPHTQPLAWLDVGDSITDPVPEHLEFHDGLRSGVIKRLLKTAPLVLGQNNDQNEIGIGWNDDNDDESSVNLETVHDFSSYCKKHLAETKIFPWLLEAIHEGGHGYVSPLTMRFSVGSFLGRHRSVVATETVAQHLRYLLRSHNEKLKGKGKYHGDGDGKIKTNMDGRRPITCSVSVGTVHRDVHKRIPQKHYKEDDADYVDKKDRL